MAGSYDDEEADAHFFQQLHDGEMESARGVTAETEGSGLNTGASHSNGLITSLVAVPHDGVAADGDEDANDGETSDQPSIDISISSPRPKRRGRPTGSGGWRSCCSRSTIASPSSWTRS